MYYHSDESGPQSNSNEGTLHIPQSTELEPCHQLLLMSYSEPYLYVYVCVYI